MALFEEEIFHEETKLKYQNNFTEDNKLLCNLGKILKEPVDNFLKNKITLTLEISKDDIFKKIDFLQNDNNDEKKLDINNFDIIINNKIYDNKNYFYLKRWEYFI